MNNCKKCEHFPVCMWNGQKQDDCGFYKEERPQGEWETPFEMNGKTYHKCTHCHISTQLILIDNFCPNCGADMRGGIENDK